MARHCAALYTDAMELSQYVSHTFSIMSNGWQRLLVSAQLLR